MDPTRFRTDAASDGTDVAVEVTTDEERLLDPDATSGLPSRLDVSPEVPVPDVIDQRRSVALDDDVER